ncbi:MAG: DUF456 domain-containing protein [Pirellulales bacterium]|nr:DUF456 domain-containing protein [Pirellulales bacterium]
MNPWLYYTLAALLIAACTLAWLGNLFGAPGNWVIAGLAALFAWLASDPTGRGVSWTCVFVLLALAAVGEVVEFVAGAAGAAKQGASRRSMIYSLVGGFTGSLLGAGAGLPVPVVGSLLGSLLGALAGGSAGAFAGAYYGEASRERPHDESIAVGKAAMRGRLWGTLGKLAIGAVMLGVTTADALIG